MTRLRFWIAIVVFMAALVHLVATVEGYRSHWLELVSGLLLVGTFALVVLNLKVARDA